MNRRKEAIWRPLDGDGRCRCPSVFELSLRGWARWIGNRERDIRDSTEIVSAIYVIFTINVSSKFFFSGRGR